MKKLILFFIMALLSTAQLKAQVEFTEIVLEDENDVQTLTLKSGTNYLHFAADRDAALKLNVGFSGCVIYMSDINGTQGSMLSTTNEADGRVYSTSVKAGNDYYFMTSLVLDPTEVRASYGTSNPISVTSSYEEGSTYTLSGSSLDLTFDRQVTVSHNWVVYGDGERAEIPQEDINGVLINQYYYSIDLRDVISGLVDNGSLREGETFTVTLEGIADAADPETVYGTDGTYSISLVLGAMPATLVGMSPEDGSYITNYYPEGSNDNLFTFTFSDELNPSGEGVSVSVTYGDVEAGSFTEVPCTFSISGNTLTVSLAGNNLPETVNTMRGGEMPTQVSFTIRGLTTADGRPVSPNYDNTGTNGIMAYYTVRKEAITFYADFTPVDGAPSLAGNEEILVWLSAPLSSFSGIRLDWTDAEGNAQNRTFSPEEAPFAWDDYYGGYVAHVSLEGIVYGEKPVTLTLLDGILTNGDPATVTATFNTDPTASCIEGIGADTDGDASLYSISGTLLRRGSRGEVLSGMPEGVYILDGKKVVVK